MIDETCDFLVIGAGVVGINIALAIKERLSEASIIIIDKEPELALHASGRNSGVLHAGFYYTADSLKARFCREGNAFLRNYCEEKGLAINRVGKLVVAKDESEIPSIDLLLERGRGNGVELEEVDEQGAREIEPRVKTAGKAIWSPTTSSVDPTEVIQAMAGDCRDSGIDLRLGAPVEQITDGTVIAGGRRIQAGHVVNAAGVYADRIARDFGYARRHRMIPFKGLYLLSDEAPGSLRTNIYPVPDLKFPFLGVHFTVTAAGKIKIGPTAAPAFWREHYTGLSGFRLSEMADILLAEAGLFLWAGFNFRGLAIEEMKKFSRKYLVKQAMNLADGVEYIQFKKWGKPGIRAQLLCRDDRTLEMDFLIEGDERSTHVLNAVSPAFTCSRPFARYVVEGMLSPERPWAPAAVLTG